MLHLLVSDLFKINVLTTDSMPNIDSKSAWKDYIRTGDIKHIHYKFRREARENVNYFPESSYTSVDFTREVLRSRNNQTLCEYHRKSIGKGTFKNDTIIEFHGMGFQGASAKKSADVLPPRPNHLNCGCPLEEVALEYFFWKTIRVRSSNPAVVTDFARSGLDKLKPSVRAFWNKSIRDYTGLNTNDFLSPNYGSPLYSARIALIQLHTQIQRLKALRAPIMVEVAFPPADISHIPASVGSFGYDEGVYITGEGLAEIWNQISSTRRVSPLPVIM